MKDAKPAYKYRFVLQYGKLKRVQNEWVFTANPYRDCPVKELSDKSKWSVVDFVFDTLNFTNE